MNTDTSSFDSALQPSYIWRVEGYRAQRAGLGVQACPYATGSEAWAVWRESWQDTQADHAFFEGVEYAKAGGKDSAANPYDADAGEHDDWLDGFFEGLSAAGVKTHGHLYLAVKN